MMQTFNDPSRDKGSKKNPHKFLIQTARPRVKKRNMQKVQKLLIKHSRGFRLLQMFEQTKREIKLLV